MIIPPRFVIEDDDPILLYQFTAYIREVVKYARLEYLRKQCYRNVESPLEQALFENLSYEDPLPFSRDSFEFEEESLSTAFDSLNELRRKILALVFVERVTAQETADRLGCSIEYVYLQKHRALKALRDQLMEGGDERG